MSMPPPPRRKFFQIHLSTAIVLMFVAGGLVWANVRIPRHIESEGYDKVFWQYYGWPKHFLIHLHADGHDPPDMYKHFDGGAITDLFVILSILFAVWLICERVIRKKG